MKMRRRIWLGGCLAGIAVLAGCERKGPKLTVVENVRKIVLLSAGTDLGFENAQRSLLASMMATKAHYQFQVESAQGKLDAQLTQLNAALETKPFAILLDALDPGSRKAELTAAVAKVTSAGVLVIGLGETSLELNCTSVIWADQRKLGKTAGELVVKALRLRSQEAGLPQVTGRVIEIRGLDNDLRCQLRHDGFKGGAWGDLGS
jgi:ABC-type sugar transport system substrate-binding protein